MRRALVAACALSVAAVAPSVRGDDAAAPSASAPAPAQSSVELATFTTSYGVDAASRPRAFNVELAASAIDGKTLAPGATLSFNDAVGERTSAFGFARAAVIRDRMMAEGTGGGACQVASTLHAAALLAGLDVVTRAPHSRPSAYIRMGLDATVAFPSIDVKIKNPRHEAVRVRAKAHGGALVVSVEGKGPRPAVTLTSEILERVPFTRTIERSDAVRDGVVQVVAYGIPGYRVRRVREITQGGATRRDGRDDTYAPTPEIVRVSPSFDVARLTKGTPLASDGAEPRELGPLVWDTASAARPALVQVRPSTRVTIANTP
jgi:vancomycin resistance protein YoaR